MFSVSLIHHARAIMMRLFPVAAFSAHPELVHFTSQENSFGGMESKAV
jgi:hypothetical protein